MRSFVIIGAGEVCRERYLSALSDLYFDDRVDLHALIEPAPSADLINLLADGPWNSPQIVEPQRSSAESTADAALALGSEHIFVVTTPTLLHVPIASQLLRAGVDTVIEKPYAGSLAQVEEFDGCLAGIEGHPFFLGYYAIEKGLPALLLSPKEDFRLRARKYVSTEGEIENAIAIAAELGNLKNVRGVLLEGQGFAAGLSQRDWVLGQDSGGNTIETFYHLVCMLVAIVPDADVEVLSTCAGVASEADQHFRRKHGIGAAETATSAFLRVGEVDATLLCAKYVASDVHERWMRFEYEKGVAIIDFETSLLTISCGSKEAQVSVPRSAKYVAQFKQALDHFDGQSVDCMFFAFRKALLLSLRIREHALRSPLISYNAGSIGKEWRDRILCGLGWESS